MPHEYFGRPEAAKRKPTGRRIPCRSRLSLWEWQSFRSYPFSRDSRGSSAHPTIPHKCRVVLGLPHEVARGGIPLCGQFHVGIEGLSAVRHVSPSGMFFLPL